MKLLSTFFLFFMGLAFQVFSQMTPTYVVSIPMRDGKSLAADIYVPSSCTSCPTILIQTPYNKNSFRNGLPLGFLQNIESSPYSWVVVDWRGFYGSFSAAVASPSRGQDGYDVMDWIVAQSWSNGKIGTWGPSALGSIQYLTAKEQHPNHTCAVPQVAHPQTHYQGYFYGGVLEKSRLEQLDALGYGLSSVVLSNPYYSIYWQAVENSTWYPASIQIPTLQIGGWYDHTIDKMTDWYEACRTSASINVRDEQWLLIGPWVHGGTGAAYVGSSNQGELTYANAAAESDTKALEFFEYYLLNTANGWELTPKINYYELGENTWNTSNASSIETLTSSELFLSSGNKLISAEGTGSTIFVSDPKNPSPTLGGPTLNTSLDQGPYDQISLESRTDVVTFSSGELLADLTVSGRVKVNLNIECDQPDADIAVRLVDVYPDGRNMLINDGIKRMRFRNGYTQSDETFMTTGQVYNVEVELPFVHYTWKNGHKLKVYLSANNSTRWDINLQNGSTMYTSGDTNTAVITVHHSALYPSKVILPGNSAVLSLKNKIHSDDALVIYPNPAKENITIETKCKTSSVMYTISNQLGQTVVQGNLSPDESIIKIGYLLPGIYRIQTEQNGSILNRIIIKE